MRRRWVGAALGLVVLGGGIAAGKRYPGLAEGMWHQMRYASFSDSRNLMRCIVYFLECMESIRFDPEAGLWNFRTTSGAGLDELGLAKLDFHNARFAPAIERLERLGQEEGESEEQLFWLALSYLRRAEAENCLEPLSSGQGSGPGDGHSGHSASHDAYCVLPLRRFHDHKDDSRRAVELWIRLLERYDEDSHLYRWLLNFSAMTVDTFPGEVPERWRIQSPFLDFYYGKPAADLISRHGWLKLEDRAAELGAAHHGVGRGVAVEDFDLDGDLDLVMADFFGPLHSYRNEGDGHFVETSEQTGLNAVKQALSLSAADFDGDGWVDLFAVRPFEHFRLLRNVGGRFEDVTTTSGLAAAVPAGTVPVSWFSTWGDLEGDGDLDLFVSGWAFEIPFLSGFIARPRLDSKLFENLGGRFRDATAAFGLGSVVRDRQFIGAAFGDFDLDGFPDLFLSGPIPATSKLLKNIGGRRFEPVELPGFTEAGFTASFVDVNQDGRLDIFQGGFNDATTATARAVFGESGYRMGDSLFLLQKADGGFEKHTDLFAGDAVISTMGTSYGDLDNDGCLDFYLGTGNPEPWFILPNLMFLGRRDGANCTGEFENITPLAGLGTLQKGHGIVFADFDQDGDQDMVSNLGGMWPADQWVSQLFVNESTTTHRWVKLRLAGTRSNRFGVGSRIKVTARRADGTELVRYRQMDNATGFGSAPYLAHIGLLDAVEITGVEVLWQGSGCRGTYSARLNELQVLSEEDCPR